MRAYAKRQWDKRERHTASQSFAKYLLEMPFMYVVMCLCFCVLLLCLHSAVAAAATTLSSRFGENRKKKKTHSFIFMCHVFDANWPIGWYIRNKNVCGVNIVANMSNFRCVTRKLEYLHFIFVYISSTGKCFIKMQSR